MEETVRVLDHGFVRLDSAMADDLSVVNAARVSFARRKDAMDESDEGLVRFLMRDRHGTPFEHNAFRFHIRCPLFVAREWFRHRVGCVVGDTVVTFVDTNGHANPKLAKTIDELWAAWTCGEVNGQAPSPDVVSEVERLLAAGLSVRAVARAAGVGRRAVRCVRAGDDVGSRTARWRIRRMRVRVLDESTGEFTTGHIVDVMDRGVQPVYEVTLANGTSITLTANHRVRTDQGWRTMGDALGLVGHGDAAVATQPCRLLVNGVELYRSAMWLRSQKDAGRTVAEMAREAGCSYHTIRKWLRRHGLSFAPGDPLRGRTPWNRGLRYHAGHALSDAHRAAISQARSGRRSNFWRGGATSRRAQIGSWTTSVAPRVHRRFDFTCRRGARLAAHAVDVVAVRYRGVRRTFDLEIAGPWHNFVANGVVVHNSFNEFSMRYAKATEDFYVPETEDVRTQVGKPGAYSFDPVEPEVAERTREELKSVYDAAYAAYERLTEAGVARELARAVMPVGAYTEFYWTVNARSLMNFISLRNAETAQREIRRYAEALERFLAARMPVTYDAFVANERRAP